MALYVDTSCLLKLLFLERETARTLALIASEARAIMSSLGKVETLTHLHGRVACGQPSRAAAKRLAQRLDRMLQTAPYDVMSSPVTIHGLASDQLASFSPRGY